MNDYYVKRKEEMIRMRKEEGMTNTEIGKRWNVTRERVRQIIGNTGREFRAIWTKNLMKSGKIKPKHYTEIDSLPGVKREWRRDWGNHRHPVKSGTVGEGMKFEELASTILLMNGIENELMPNRCDYNIKTENGTRIEVTVSNIDASGFKSQKTVYPTWSIPVRRKECWDFLFAFVPDPREGYTYYIIPRTALEHLQQYDARIRIPHPQESNKPSKWKQYHKRIDLVK